MKDFDFNEMIKSILEYDGSEEKVINDNISLNSMIPISYIMDHMFETMSVIEKTNADDTERINNIVFFTIYCLFKHWYEMKPEDKVRWINMEIDFEELEGKSYYDDL